MLCHDQLLDRRIIAQAESLIGIGHRVTLLALSLNCDREEEILKSGIKLVRIGLSSIIPENECYCKYITRQEQINDSLNRAACRMPKGLPVFNRVFRFRSRSNWLSYRLGLLFRFRNFSLADPLPFKNAFLNEGWNHTADLVQVHDLPTLEAGSQLATEWDVPLVYDAHELYPEQHSFSTRQRLICSEAEARLIRNARLVFTVNPSIAEEMARRYRIAMPITLLNAIDPPPTFDPSARYDLLRGKLNLSNNRRILLFQGGFSPHRNLEKLIQAFTKVRTESVDLVLLGFGEFEKKLKRISAALKLLDRRVYFLPAVPQSELLQHSGSANMGIIPYPHSDLNSYYCTPNKLFEYIQAGLPILANDSPELRRFVSDEGFGLVRPMQSVKQLAAAIDDAFSTGDFGVWKRRLEERRAGFTWKVQSQIYMDAMRPLLREPGYFKEHTSVHKACAGTH
jgi:glycosyltransferase involved in cell wall biosynthesis